MSVLNFIHESANKYVCSICLSYLGFHRSCMTQNCFHFFHNKCIKQWMSNSNRQNPHRTHSFRTSGEIPTCPNCREVFYETIDLTTETINNMINQRLHCPNKCGSVIPFYLLHFHLHLDCCKKNNNENMEEYKDPYSSYHYFEDDPPVTICNIPHKPSNKQYKQSILLINVPTFVSDAHNRFQKNLDKQKQVRFSALLGSVECEVTFPHNNTTTTLRLNPFQASILLMWEDENTLWFSKDNISKTIYTNGNGEGVEDEILNKQLGLLVANNILQNEGDMYFLNIHYNSNLNKEGILDCSENGDKKIKEEEEKEEKWVDNDMFWMNFLQGKICKFAQIYSLTYDQIVIKVYDMFKNRLDSIYLMKMIKKSFSILERDNYISYVEKDGEFIVTYIV
jgi:hypothetical protein